jgi:hypothetical protein
MPEDRSHLQRLKIQGVNGYGTGVNIIHLIVQGVI